MRLALRHSFHGDHSSFSGNCGYLDAENPRLPRYCGVEESPSPPFPECRHLPIAIVNASYDRNNIAGFGRSPD